MGQGKQEAVVGAVEHILMFKLKPMTSEEEASLTKLIVDGLNGIAVVQSTSFGKNYTDSEQAYTHGLVVHFASKADEATYQTHPEHIRVRDEVIKPVVDLTATGPKVLALDYECVHGHALQGAATVKHVVLFKFKLMTSEEEASLAKQIVDGLNGITGVLSTSFGKNYTDRGQGFTHGLLVHFAAKADEPAYQIHQEHVRVRDDLILPAIDQTAENPVLHVDYECVYDPLN